MLAETLCFCVLLFVFSKWYYSSKGIPPSIREPWPIFLSSARIFLKNEESWEKIKYICKESLETGGLCHFYLGLRRVYAVTDPDDSYTVLNSLADKSIMYDVLRPWLGDGLLTAPAPMAKLHRKLIGPIQSLHNFDIAVRTFNSQSKSFLQNIAQFAGGKPFSLLPHLSRYTLVNFCVTIMGLHNWEALDLDIDQYTESVQEILTIIRKRMENIFYYSDTIYNWSRLKRDQDKTIKVINSTAIRMIEESKSILYADSGSRKVKASGERVLSDIVFELLEKGIFTDQLVLDEVGSAIFAGSDTTAYTLLYTMVLLGSNPEIQEKALEEIQLHLNGKVDISKEDLPKLVYIDAILKESMRLYPYVPVLGRYLVNELKLKNYTLPAGSECYVCVFGAHRHSSWGADVEQFRPERWLSADEKPAPTPPMLLFGAGPRVCMGKKYAMMSMKIVLVNLLRTYRFKADRTKMELQYNMVIVPKTGHYISIEKRT